MLAHYYEDVEIQFAETKLNYGSYVIPEGYVNATQMCKANNKEWKHYNELKSTKDYISALSEAVEIPTTTLVISVMPEKGLDPKLQGTWIHKNLVLHLAQWLSPKFYVWCNLKLEELMQSKHPEAVELSIAEQMVMYWQAQVKLEKEQKLIKEDLNLIKKDLKEQEKKNDYYDTELQRYRSSHGDYYSVIGFARLVGIQVDFNTAKGLGTRCTNLCTKLNIKKEFVNDPRFGEVGAYPVTVLKEVFEKKYKININF